MGYGGRPSYRGTVLLRELWDGPRAGIEDAALFTGVDEVCDSVDVFVVMHSVSAGRLLLWRH